MEEDTHMALNASSSLLHSSSPFATSQEFYGAVSGLSAINFAEMVSPNLSAFQSATMRFARHQIEMSPLDGRYNKTYATDFACLEALEDIGQLSGGGRRNQQLEELLARAQGNSNSQKTSANESDTKQQLLLEISQVSFEEQASNNSQVSLQQQLSQHPATINYFQKLQELTKQFGSNHQETSWETLSSKHSANRQPLQQTSNDIATKRKIPHEKKEQQPISSSETDFFDVIVTALATTYVPTSTALTSQVNSFSEPPSSVVVQEMTEENDDEDVCQSSVFISSIHQPKSSSSTRSAQILSEGKDQIEKEVAEVAEGMDFEEFSLQESVMKAEEASEQSCSINYLGAVSSTRLQPHRKRDLGVQYVLPRSMKQIEVYLINGEIIVNFEVFKHTDTQHNKVSQWNLFRPLNSITVKKKQVEVELHKSQGTMSNFYPLIERLMNIQDDQAYASAKLLQKHYASLQDEQVIKQQVHDVYQSHVTHLQWQLEENYHKSKNMAYQIMDKLPDDALYLYSIRRTDPTTLDSIFCSLGYSKALIRLIAGSEQNYTQFCLRQGLAEMFDGQSILQILLMNLLFSNKIQISVTTLDDFTIPCEMRVHYQKLVSTEILPGVFKEDYMKMYHILVDSKYFEEIAILRGTPTTHSEVDSQSILRRIVVPDSSYTHSATKFVEKFYSDTTKEKKQKTANSMDPFDFSAEFEKVFGGQSEGSNYLDSVYNTKVTPNSSIPLTPRNYTNRDYSQQSSSPSISPSLSSSKSPPLHPCKNDSEQLLFSAFKPPIYRRLAAAVPAFHHQESQEKLDAQLSLRIYSCDNLTPSSATPHVLAGQTTATENAGSVASIKKNKRIAKSKKSIATSQ